MADGLRERAKSATYQCEAPRA